MRTIILATIAMFLANTASAVAEDESALLARVYHGAADGDPENDARAYDVTQLSDLKVRFPQGPIHGRLQRRVIVQRGGGARHCCRARRTRSAWTRTPQTGKNTLGYDHQSAQSLSETFMWLAPLARRGSTSSSWPCGHTERGRGNCRRP